MSPARAEQPRGSTRLWRGTRAATTRGMTFERLPMVRRLASRYDRVVVEWLAVEDEDAGHLVAARVEDGLATLADQGRARITRLLRRDVPDEVGALLFGGGVVVFELAGWRVARVLAIEPADASAPDIADRLREALAI
jgi:hypothetical protein